MKARARGFSLLEVLVAFALLAAALTLLLGALSSAATRVGQAGSRARAVLHAQSLLAAAGVAEPLRIGRQQGQWEQGRYQWQLQVQPYVEAPRADGATGVQAMPTTAGAGGGPQLLQLELQVGWQGSRAGALRWRTLRLVSTPLEASP